MKKAVVAFGRMNPPTVGHEKLANKIKSVATKEKAKPFIYLSHSQDRKKNPLDYNTKIRIASKAFGNLVTKSSARNIIEVLKELQTKRIYRYCNRRGRRPYFRIQKFSHKI
jgi:nicotinic acid mononucleotide adenylyltransferase